MIETVELGATGRQITRLGLGGCPLGGHGWGRVDDDESRAAVRCALDLGVNFFDTADVYGLGHSEELLAEALGARRKQVVLCSKFGVKWDSSGRTSKDTSPAYLRKALEASLRRLRVDCIPLYYIHWPDGLTPISDTMAELERVRAQGKIRWIGVSNFSAAQLHEAVQVGVVSALQVQFSLVDRDLIRSLLPSTRRQPITLVTWGSLAQGLLTGKFDAACRFAADDRRHRYQNFSGEKLQRNLKVVELLQGMSHRLGRTSAQLAMRWLLDTPGVGCVLFGAKRPSQVRENVAAAGWHLSAEDYETLHGSGEPLSVSAPPTTDIEDA